MPGNYLISAYRFLVRHKLFSFLNIFGLAVGMASFLFIYLYVDYETSYDSQWADADRIYRITTYREYAGRDPAYFSRTSYLTGGLFEENFSEEIEEIAVIEPSDATVLRADGESFEQNLTIAKDGFFHVFQFENVNGGVLPPLPDNNSVYLSEEAAFRYFGDSDPIGKTLQIDTGYSGGFIDFTVRAVFKDLPPNVHFPVDMVRRFDDSLVEEGALNWGFFTMFTYIKLREGVSISQIKERMPAVKAANIPPRELGNGRTENMAELLNFRFVPVRDMYLKDKAYDVLYFPEKGDLNTVRALQIVAGIILIIACVNFTNLSVAQAGMRAREVALRKTLGSSRARIFGQFLFETFLLALIAMTIAVVFVQLSIPIYREILDKPLEFSLFKGGEMLTILGLLLFFITLIGGLYPAYYLSRFQPAEVLKANKSSASHKTVRLRQALVVLQFAASIALIISAYVVYQQTNYARSLEKGFQQNGQLLVHGLSRILEEEQIERSKLLRDRFADIPGVTVVSLSRALPNVPLGNLFTMRRTDAEAEASLLLADVDPNYDEAYGLTLLAGRFFDESQALDRYKRGESLETGFNIVLNEAAVKALGFQTPADAVNQGLNMSVNGGTTPVTIIGVMRDVQYGSIRAKVEPSFFFFAPFRFNTATVRYEGRPAADVRADVEAIWSEIVPDYPAKITFLDDDLAVLYQDDQKRGALFAVFSGLAVLTGCLGLFGLSALSTQQRTMEIGVRKVMGANPPQIVRLLSWQFTKYVLIANVIGWPVAWIISDRWLDGFADRISLGYAPFVLATLLTLAVAWTTIASLAFKASRISPIHALREE